MTFLAVIYPVFTMPYLRLWYFPWILPLPLLFEVIAFLLLNPRLTGFQLALTILGGNLVAMLIGFGVAFVGQAITQGALGIDELNWSDHLMDFGLLLAVVLTCVVKCVAWRISFGPSRYLQRVVIVVHGVSFCLVCAAYHYLPYLGLIKIPDIPGS